jgi:RNA polymerase sigma-70 factor (ECF subfamily)
VSAAERHLRLISASEPPKRAPAAGPALDDSAILAGLRDRDPAVCTAFYERVRPIVDRTLSRLLGASDPDYEDTAQVALYELVDTIERFRGECPLDAWLSIVTARVVYRQIRKRRLERRLFSQSSLDDAAPAVASMPTSFATRNAVERVRDHLLRMDSNRSWTYLLHDVYGYDLKEIGEIMGASLSAAQSRLVRARRELHDRIRGDAELANYLDDLAEDSP